MLPSADSINLRLNAIEEAQKRSRGAAVVVTIVSLMMIITSYNAFLSLNFFQAANAAKRSEYLPVNGTISERLKGKILDEWVLSRMASISLLGIRVDIDDAPQLGSIAMFVVSIWLVLALRRENQSIGSLLRDTQRSSSDKDSKDDLDTRWMVFHGVISYSVFTSLNKSFKAISSLKRTDPHPGPDSVNVFMFVAATSLVHYLPLFSLIFVASMEYNSYFMNSPFRDGAAPPFSNLSNIIKHIRSDDPSGKHILASWILFLTFFSLTCVVTFYSRRFRKSTEAVLGEYLNELKIDTYGPH